MLKTPEPVRRFTWPHYYLVALFVRFYCWLLGGFVVRGREHLPKRGGALVCSNHTSFLDPPTLGAAIIPRRTYYFAKKELFHNPLFGYFIRKCYAFPVDRESGDREAIRHATELLRQGELLVLFPEGGRSSDGALHAGNIGPALIASKAGVPIIPVALMNTNVALPIKGRPRRCRVSVDFGEPIDPAQFGEGRLSREQMEAFTEALMSAIYELQKAQYARVGRVAPPRSKEQVHASEDPPPGS